MIKWLKNSTKARDNILELIVDETRQHETKNEWWVANNKLNQKQKQRKEQRKTKKKGYNDILKILNKNILDCSTYSIAYFRCAMRGVLMPEGTQTLQGRASTFDVIIVDHNFTKYLYIYICVCVCV